MYPVLIAIQVISIVLIVILLYALFRRPKSDLMRVMIFLCAALLINQTGYLFEMLAKTKEAAIVAVRFSYLGKMTALIFIFIFILTFVGYRVKRIITYPLSISSFAIVALVWTSDYHKLYYTSVDFVHEGMFDHLVLEHGIFYYVFMGLTFIYLIAMVAVCAVKLIKYKDNLTRKKILLVLAVPLISFVAILVWNSGITKGYDPTATGYLLQVVIMYYAIYRFDIISPLDSAREDLIENLQDPICIINESGDVIYSNRKFRQITASLKATELISELDTIKNLFYTGKDYCFQNRFYQIKKSSIKQGDSVICSAYTLSDITEIHRTNEKLIQAREEANVANKAKSEFLANMSHEIRTPINAVLGMDTMILRECKDVAIRKYALDIQGAGRSLLSIINDILDFSKIESGKMELVPVEYDVASMLNDVVNMIRPKAEDKKLEFSLEVSENIPNALFGDDVRLKQVLINLLTNAVKYTPNGIVKLCIQTEYDDEKNLRITFSVKDSGIGIKPEDISKLTEEFVRIEESRNRNIEGTGLGINIVVSLLKLMGSRLEVESVYGEGSNFFFTVVQPIADARPMGNLEERLKALAEMDQDYATSFIIPDCRLLVVDDNAMNRKVFINLLKDLQCVIDEAESGFECLDLIREHTYDIIFMDHMMPEMDGIETLKRMQTSDDHLNSDTPVVILTARAIIGAKEEYFAAGFDEYLTKPIDADQLEKVIDSLISEDRKEVVKKTESYVQVEEEDVDLPFIDGVDWKAALSKLHNMDLLIESVKNYSLIADVDMSSLQRFYQNLISSDYQEGWDEFRIKVHSMKSNVATIGAAHLAGLAKYLEYAARDQDGFTINNLMPIFMREWDALKIAIDDGFGISKEQENAQENTIERDELVSLLDILRMAMEELDMDRADAIMEELQEYSYVPEQKSLLEQLRAYVLNMDSEQCNQIILNWVDMLEK